MVSVWAKVPSKNERSGRVPLGRKMSLIKGGCSLIFAQLKSCNAVSSGTLPLGWATAGASLLSCRPTAPTSIRSRMPSPSSRRCSGEPHNEPSTASGTPLALSSIGSRLKNAPTTSPPQDTMQADQKPLLGFGLIQTQNAMMAARTTADKKLTASLS